jgi:hypothetical protein
MKYIITYKKDTGDLFGCSTWREGALKSVERSFKNNPNIGVMEGDFKPDNISDYRVTNGVIVLKQDSEIALRKKEEQMEAIRIRRNKLLSDSDYTQLGDVYKDKSGWATYRQQLRDLPSTITDPFNVTWPTPPE